MNAKSCNLRIVYVTCGENGLYGLKYLLDRGYRFSQVVTISNEVAKKNNVSGFANVADECQKWNIKLTTLENYDLKVEDLENSAPDLLIVNGWNRLIKSEVIQCFKYGGIGIHAGHPPIGLGRAPLPWNIIKGFKDIEVYVFKLTESADDGDIVAIQTIEITPFDNVKTLYEKVMFFGVVLFEQVLQQYISGTVQQFSQSREHLVYYPKRTPADGCIDFSLSVEDIYNFIRAQTHPYPGAYAFLENQKWYFWTAIPFDCYAFRNETRTPGKVIAALPSGIVIQTASSPLWLLHATADDEIVVPADNIAQYVGKVFSSKN
ncbi:MAG: hypothetical protein NVS2B14_13640 [Chamaesiphon sp.]